MLNYLVTYFFLIQAKVSTTTNWRELPRHDYYKLTQPIVNLILKLKLYDFPFLILLASCLWSFWGQCSCVHVDHQESHINSYEKISWNPAFSRKKFLAMCFAGIAKWRLHCSDTAARLLLADWINPWDSPIWTAWEHFTLCDTPVPLNIYFIQDAFLVLKELGKLWRKRRR